MRHAYIRGILSIIWLAVAIISRISGNLEMALLYAVIGFAFWYSAYSMWKKETNGKGEK